jgi:hypothetical protein
VPPKSASGVRITRWDSGKLGEAVKFILESEGGGKRVAQQLQRLAEEARRVAEHAERAAKEWPEETPARAGGGA